jgi:hypothetical protein
MGKITRLCVKFAQISQIKKSSKSVKIPVKHPKNPFHPKNRIYILPGMGYAVNNLLATPRKDCQMKKILVLVVFALVTQLSAQNLFNPLSQLLLPGGGTNPQTGANAGNANSTAVALGGAIGGILGSKKQKTAEGTAIGSALGLILGQMLGGNPQNGGLLPQGPDNANLPQIDPATGLPVDPNAPAGNLPVIDPTTGLPVAGPGKMPIPNGGVPTPRVARQRAVNKLFGR